MDATPIKTKITGDGTPPIRYRVHVLSKHGDWRLVQASSNITRARAIEMEIRYGRYDKRALEYVLSTNPITHREVKKNADPIDVRIMRLILANAQDGLSAMDIVEKLEMSETHVLMSLRDLLYTEQVDRVVRSGRSYYMPPHTAPVIPDLPGAILDVLLQHPDGLKANAIFEALNGHIPHNMRYILPRMVKEGVLKSKLAAKNKAHKIYYIP